jgi:hypothetical protein
MLSEGCNFRHPQRIFAKTQFSISSERQFYRIQKNLILLSEIEAAESWARVRSGMNENSSLLLLGTQVDVFFPFVIV